MGLIFETISHSGGMRVQQPVELASYIAFSVAITAVPPNEESPPFATTGVVESETV